MKFYTVALCVFLVFGGGCGSAPGQAQGPELFPSDSREGEDAPNRQLPAPRPDVSNREELTVVLTNYSLQLDPRKSFDATEAQIFTALYEGLLSYNPLTLEPVLAVAQSYDLSSDKKTWTFTLRESAHYWNGDQVQAGHFRDAWLSLIEPGKNSPYSSLFDVIDGAKDYRLGKLKDASKVGISAPDPQTLVVRLKSPASFFPSMLCHHSFSPIHPSMLKLGDWSRESPVSNGPFYILERRQDRLILARNELYWDLGKVALKRLILRFTSDGQEAASLWNTGEARWIAGVVSIEDLGDKSGIVVNPMFATHYYFIRSVHKPLNDKRVRRALSIALPWEEMREGQYLPAKTLVYPGLPGYPAITGAGETNIAEAKNLLAQAGYPGGKNIPELVIRLNPSEEANRIGGLIASAWHDQLGLQVKVEVMPYEAYFDSLSQDNYDVGITTWIGDFADPYTFLQMWRADSNLNDAGHNDPDYEALMERSMAEEGVKRWETLAEAENLLLDRGTVLPISYSPAINIVDTNELEGWFPNIMDIHPFKYFSYKTLRALPGMVQAHSQKPLFLL